MLGAGFAIRSGTEPGIRRTGVSPSTGSWPGTSIVKGGFVWKRGIIVGTVVVMMGGFDEYHGRKELGGRGDSSGNKTCVCLSASKNEKKRERGFWRQESEEANMLGGGTGGFSIVLSIQGGSSFP